MISILSISVVLSLVVTAVIVIEGSRATHRRRLMERRTRLWLTGKDPR